MSVGGAPGGHAADAVAATGTDPGLLTRVLAWLLRPRRTADALRRRCAEVDAGAPAERLRAVLGEPSPTERAAATELLGTWRRLGVSAALVGDPAYPPQLAEGWPLTDGPALLTWSGVPPGGQPSVGIVGARRASGYGSGVAAWLAATVARAGVRVVSGGARGVDAAAHRAALEEPGGTSVVLGCGHAVAYPRVHAAPGGLFEQILDHGGTLLSEQLPYASPHAGNVRSRNRIVAGLCRAVVVVEGSARSGALVTAGAAAERGVGVLAVPGDVRAPGSAAPHQLLVEGAAPCRGPQDVLEAVGGAVGAWPQGADPDDARPGGGHAGRGGRGAPATPAEDGGPTAPAGLPDDLGRVLAARWPRPVRVEELAAETGRSVPALLGALTQARVAGLVAESVEGVRLRRAP